MSKPGPSRDRREAKRKLARSAASARSITRLGQPVTVRMGDGSFHQTTVTRLPWLQGTVWFVGLACMPAGAPCNAVTSTLPSTAGAVLAKAGLRMERGGA